MRPMNQAAFQALLHEFARASGARRTSIRPGVGTCEYRGVSVAVYFDEATDRSHLHTYIDFGAVPPEQQQRVYGALLRDNFRLQRRRRCFVGVDQETGRVVLVARIALEPALDGDRLADILGELIRAGDAWHLPDPRTRPVRLPIGPSRHRRRPS